jgi:hypothetical protein
MVYFHDHSSQLNATNKEKMDRHTVNTGLTEIKKTVSVRKNPEPRVRSCRQSTSPYAVSGTSEALLKSNETLTYLSVLKLTGYEIQLRADNSKAVEIS